MILRHGHLGYWLIQIVSGLMLMFIQQGWWLTTGRPCRACWSSSDGFEIYPRSCSVHLCLRSSLISLISSSCEISLTDFHLSCYHHRRHFCRPLVHQRLTERVSCRASWCCSSWQHYGWSVLPQQLGCERTATPPTPEATCVLGHRVKSNNCYWCN